MADVHFEDRDSTWARTAKDLIAGAAGGIAQVLIGMRSTDVSFLLLALCSQPRNSDSSAFRWTMMLPRSHSACIYELFSFSYYIEPYDVAIIPKTIGCWQTDIL
jgi:hypothetical protein